MMNFPDTPEYQEAHYTPWQKFLKALKGLDEVTALEALWAIVKQEGYCDDIGAVLAYFDGNGGYTLQFMPRHELIELRLDDARMLGLMAAIQNYDPTRQFVMMAVYEQPEADVAWADTMVVQMPGGLSAGD